MPTVSVSSSQTSNKAILLHKTNSTTHTEEPQGARNQAREPTEEKKHFFFFSFVNGPLAVLAFAAKTNFQKPKQLSSDHETHSESVGGKKKYPMP